MIENKMNQDISRVAYKNAKNIFKQKREDVFAIVLRKELIASIKNVYKDCRNSRDGDNATVINELILECKDSCDTANRLITAIVVSLGLFITLRLVKEDSPN